MVKGTAGDGESAYGMIETREVKSLEKFYNCGGVERLSNKSIRSGFLFSWTETVIQVGGGLIGSYLILCNDL